MPTYRTMAGAAALLLGLGLACDFSPTAPFEGFDGMGSRISGTFSSQGTSGSALTAKAQSTFEGMSVFVRQDPSIRADVKSNGTFVLAGVPSGTVTLVFERQGKRLNSLTFRDVMANQEIRVVLELTESGRVTLLEENRDPGDLGECARGAGFWCQNQNGQNPNLSAARFDELGGKAASRLKDVAALDTADEIGAAVCNQSDQLLRQLATLALNLEAKLVSEGTALQGEDVGTVKEAFDRAVAVANDSSASRSERNAIKDVLDRINNNVNTDGPCSTGELPEDEDEPDDDRPPSNDLPAACQGWVSGGQVTICHYPPGNPSARHTITIGIPAWPAHQGHGDTCGPCP